MGIGMEIGMKLESGNHVLGFFSLIFLKRNLEQYSRVWILSGILDSGVIKRQQQHNNQ